MTDLSTTVETAAPAVTVGEGDAAGSEAVDSGSSLSQQAAQATTIVEETTEKGATVDTTSPVVVENVHVDGEKEVSAVGNADANLTSGEKEEKREDPQGKDEDNSTVGTTPPRPTCHSPPAPTAVEVPDEDDDSRRIAAAQGTEDLLPAIEPAMPPSKPSPPLTPTTVADPTQAATQTMTQPTAPSTAPTPPAEPPETGPYVRPYDSSIDYDDCLEICIQTTGPSLRSLINTQYQSIISSIWCKPYLLFSPSTCFVLDDGSGCHPPPPPSKSTTSSTINTTSTSAPAPLSRPKGKAVGYIIGTPSTSQFIKQYQSDYLPLLDVHYSYPPTPSVVSDLGSNAWLMNTLFDPEKGMRVTEFEGEYEAHFHIDILEGWRNQGWGPRLLETWEEEVRRAWRRRGGNGVAGGGGGGGVGGVHVGLDPKNDAAARWYKRMGFEERTVGRGGRWMVKKL